MLSRYDPFIPYGRAMAFRLIQKVKQLFPNGCQQLMTWDALGPLAILLQPMIVFGLNVEDSASLTRAIMLSHWSTALMVWAMGFFWIALLLLWFHRFILGLRIRADKRSPTLLKALGVCMGMTAAVAAMVPDKSPTLLIGYTLSMLYILWATAIIDRKVHRNE